MEMTIDPLTILKTCYDPQDPLFALLVEHGQQVARKALAVADNLSPKAIDHQFLWEAALLHDIGIYKTHAPQIGCYGSAPYVCHGILGREILEAQGLPRHALVCERHVGVGIKRAEIRNHGLPLPERNMQPVTLEETLICYADKFFSKAGPDAGQPKEHAHICRSLERFGERAVAQFNQWIGRFEPTRCTNPCSTVKGKCHDHTYQSPLQPI